MSLTMADDKDEKKLEEEELDDDEGKEEGEEEGETKDPSDSKEGKKIQKWGLTTLLLGGSVVITLLIAVVFFILWLRGPKDEMNEDTSKDLELAQIDQKIKETIYYDIDNIVVNLRSNSSRPRLLKLSVHLELADEKHKSIIKGFEPRLIDQFHTFLRGLSMEEIEGPGGIQRLKEDLTLRINAILAPIKIRSVLIRELLTQ